MKRLTTGLAVGLTISSLFIGLYATWASEPSNVNLVKRLVAKTNTPATASPFPACASDQLQVLASASLGAAGAGAMAFDIVNRGSSCRIGGYPEVTFQNASGVAVDRHNVHQPSMLFAEPKVATVTLVRGGAATFGVSWNNNTVNNVPYNNHTCPKTAYAVVVLRQGVGSLWGQIPIDPQPCGDTLSVTPIESGTWPRPNG